MASLARLDNAAARRVFLDRHALIEAPTGPARGAHLLDLIRRLGFVQVDSVNTVERAHHMILWSRRQAYRPEHLRPLLERDRTLFEHWTHDAAVIPTEFLPYWQHRFDRDFAELPQRWEGWQGTAFRDKVDEVLTHIRAGGPVRSGEVSGEDRRPSGGWWDWHPSKAALEYLWRSGRLAVCRREGFAKIYDLAERVYPACERPTPDETTDWACRAALDRLGFATSGELAAFWWKVSPEAAKAWCAAALDRGEIEQVRVEGADGRDWTVFARPGLAEMAAGISEPGPRVRILSPFDPALRDRRRAERLFGFHYRIEIFVPEDRRRFGYYVFPVMEGTRLIGRLDARCQRQEGRLAVAAFWPEAKVRMGAGRLARLEAELARLAQFTACPDVVFAPGWIRPAAEPDT